MIPWSNRLLIDKNDEERTALSEFELAIFVLLDGMRGSYKGPWVVSKTSDGGTELSGKSQQKIIVKAKKFSTFPKSTTLPVDARANISGSATANAVRNHSGYSLLVDELKRPELSEVCDLQNNRKLDRTISW